MSRNGSDSDNPSTGHPTEKLGADTPTLEHPKDAPFPAPSPPGISAPGYKVLELLGLGGMGEVYAAQQERPVRRKVALKVIKLGMDSRQVVARFESERQALALMNHPNIAKVYDAGTTDAGRPFFSMEYVAGEPITNYCDRYRLSVRERLELFVEVCGGVQHAHQKGIIHRDLKPSNVLITMQDDEPVAKIIDFGVAKATAQPLTEESMHTRLGALIGTLEYMSPEQAELRGLDIDTRSDVYSLGVLLYELLVGELPFPSERLRESALDEVRRIICEAEPARPSTRLDTGDETASDTARNRSRELPALVRQLRGDLDWITLKAMAKDRTHRYQTVNALALDITRYLSDEPVLARPPSTAYRLKKFVRRHRAGVAAALLIALAVFAGAVGTTLGLLRALRAERVATEEAEAARQVSDFLVDLFEVADPLEAQGETITARRILDEGSRRISRELRDQPEIQARLMDTMGTVYRHLGLFEESRDLIEPALESRQELLGDDSLEAAQSLYNLAHLDYLQARYEESRTLAERALAIREARLGPDDPQVAETLMVLAWSSARQLGYDVAMPLFERALAIREAALGADHPKSAETLSALGAAHRQNGDPKAAEPLLRQALATYERALAPNDFRLGASLNDLAIVYWDQGRLAEAEPLLERAIAIKERALGPDHYSVAKSLNNLALIYDGQDRAAEAEPVWERSLAILELSLGAEHDETAMGVANLAWASYRLGKFEEAERLYDRSRAIYERTVGPHDVKVAILERDRARLHTDRGEYARAESSLRQAAEIWEASGGPDHPRLADSLDALGDLLVATGRLAEAEPLFQRALAIREAKLGPDHAATLETAAAHAELLGRLGRDPGAGER